MRAILAAALAAVVFTVLGSSVLADEWVAVRLRGSVLQLVDGEWQKLRRNDVVPDSRVIRTLRTGNVEFTRGNETVTIGPDTQIQIFDENRRKPFTTVKQYFGTVTVEAEVRQVQHFAVRTPYLAAVVKGTRFTVTSGDRGADVEVERGSVRVENKGNNDAVTIVAGQSAGVEKGSSKFVVAGNPTSAKSPAADAADRDGGKKDKNSNGNSGNALGVTVNGGNGNGNGNNGNGNGNGGANVGVSLGGISASVSVGGGSSGNGNSGSGSGNSGSGNSGGNNGNGNSGNGNGGNLLNVTVGPLKLGL